jgi:RNA polymerase sigma factor (sigma-70 family)
VAQLIHVTAVTDHAIFENLVDQFYQPLFRFAYSLSKSEATACDLTQQTFFIWATKGHQLRDASKAKSWLFTTLHREFLAIKKRESRYPHYEIEMMEAELPQVTPEAIRNADVNDVLDALNKLEEVFRAPLLLFHLQDHSYKEIAEVLDIPIGTVMSRIARGREHLFRRLADGMTSERGSKNVIDFPDRNPHKPSKQQ